MFEMTIALSGAVISAYEQTSGAYEVAVDVSMFTWHMFYLRAVATFVAAWYLTAHNQKFNAIVLLILAAMLTLGVTRVQMEQNQRVIQKMLAAGYLLEIRNPELGYRFRHEVHVAGAADACDAHWNQLRQDLEREYTAKQKGSDEYIHSVVRPKHWQHFGIFPNTWLFALIYGGIHVLYAAAIGLTIRSKKQSSSELTRESPSHSANDAASG